MILSLVLTGLFSGDENRSAAAKAILNKRVLVILRGISGSGKSTLSKEIQSHSTEYGARAIICSADDYFMRNGVYEFDNSKLSAAHSWSFNGEIHISYLLAVVLNRSQRRCQYALIQGFSPILVDNTNTQKWEAKPYVEMAVLRRCFLF